MTVIRPMVNRDSQAFWDGTAAGELRIQVCNACGAKRFPPGPACPDCGALDRGFEATAGRGTVFSYVVHRYPAVPGKEMPIVISPLPAALTGSAPALVYSVMFWPSSRI